MKLSLPTIADLCSLIRSIKRDIPRKGDHDYNSYRDISVYEMDDDTTPATIDLTIGWTPYDGWNYQTGDNSYSGGSYGHPVWGVTHVARADNARGHAKYLIGQLLEGYDDWKETQNKHFGGNYQ